MTQHIVVIGAGIVGAACAIELLRDGNRVTIVEPGEPGGEQEQLAAAMRLGRVSDSRYGVMRWGSRAK